MIQAAFYDLPMELMERVKLVARMTSWDRNLCSRVSQERIDDALKNAQVAVKSSDAGALEEALKLMDLLTLELCDEWRTRN